MRWLLSHLSEVLYVLLALWIFSLSAEWFHTAFGWGVLLAWGAALLASMIPLLNSVLAWIVLVNGHEWTWLGATITLVLLNAAILIAKRISVLIYPERSLSMEKDS